jgi:hypothetical protein
MLRFDLLSNYLAKTVAPPIPRTRTVSELLSGGSDPVISKKPVGAWRRKAYDAMK